MEILAEVGQWAWYLIWILLLLVASLLVYVGLGGNFIILGLALVHAVVTGFSSIGWKLLVVLAVLVAVGEGLEFILGTFYVAKKGASRTGIVLAFVGGLCGAALGSPVLPVVGTILGSFVGAFAGAIGGEYIEQRRVEPSVRIGAHAFLGKMLAILVKHAISLVMVLLVLLATWPR